MTTPGLAVADVELMIIMMGGRVTQATIRQWVSRGNITRRTDGRIDPDSVIRWWKTQRNHHQAARRANVA